MPINFKPGAKTVSLTPVATPPQSTPPTVKPEVEGPQTKTVEKPKPSELAALIAKIREDKGEKVILRARDVPDVKRIATGLFEFDFATGGGFPCGRYSMIYGPESSCKSNLAYLAVAEAQRGPDECNKAVWVDLEHTFDPKWAVLFGVDIDALIVVKPGYGEEAVDLVDALIRAEDVAIMVVDSIAVMVASKEVEGTTEKQDVGTAPTLVKRMCNKIIMALSMESRRDHAPAVIFINQIRYKIGVMYGNPETTPGGKTKDFLTSLTIRVQGKPKIVKGYNPDLPVFKEIEARIVKAKVGVIRSNFAFDMALMAVGDLSVGESPSWGLVKDELQSAGLLQSLGGSKGYTLDGKTWKTQKMIEDTYYAEKSFAMHLQKMVIDQYSSQKYILDDTKKIENEAPKNE